VAGAEKVCAKRKKPWFKKSEMHGGFAHQTLRKFDQNAASQQGAVVSASKTKRR
jgi:hypothetical protein